MRSNAIIFFLSIFAFGVVCLADSGDPHAGKPILRDTTVSAPAGSSAPAKPVMDIDSGQVALALTAVIGMILLLRSVAKHIFPAAITGGRAGAVKVVARCPLGPRQQIVLLQVGRRVVVIGDSAAQMSCLCQITEADEVASLLGQIRQERTSSTSSPFTSWFNRATEAFTGDEAELAEPREPNTDIADEPPPPKEPADGLDDLTARVRRLARQFSDSSPKI